MSIELIGLLVLSVGILAAGLRGPWTKEKILFVVATAFVAYLGLTSAAPTEEALRAEIAAAAEEAKQQQVSQADRLYQSRIEAAEQTSNVALANRLEALQEQAAEHAASYLDSVLAAAEEGRLTIGPLPPPEVAPSPLEEAIAFEYPIAPGTRPLFVRRIETRPLGRVELGEPPSPDVTILYGYSPIGPSLDRVRTRLLLGQLDLTAAIDRSGSNND